MLTIDTLKEFGANTDEGMSRCFGNADFYLRLVKSVTAEQGFDTLRDAVENKDLDAAFEAAHALKGVLGNLSLTPIYEPVCEITELLRAKTDTDYTALINQITEQKELLLSLCAE